MSKKFVRRVEIPDETIADSGLKVFLKTGDFSHSFVRWLDALVGFKTKLKKYSYNPLSCMHIFDVEKYDQTR